MLGLSLLCVHGTALLSISLFAVLIFECLPC